MTSEELRKVSERVFKEVLEGGNVNALDQLYAKEMVYHRPGQPDRNGLAAYKQLFSGLTQAFSDIQFSFDDMVLEGDHKGVGRWKMVGTHTGQLPDMSIPPTGKRITMTGLTLSYMVNGMVVEAWEYADMMGFAQQAGLIPGGPGK